jgi:hypothetical protein
MESRDDIDQGRASGILDLVEARIKGSLGFRAARPCSSVRTSAAINIDSAAGIRASVEATAAIDNWASRVMSARGRGLIVGRSAQSAIFSPPPFHAFSAVGHIPPLVASATVT